MGKCRKSNNKCSKEKNLDFTIVERSCILWTETWFYGKDAIGREWQLGTIQVDYNLPERFDLNYKDNNNKNRDLYDS